MPRVLTCCLLLLALPAPAAAAQASSPGDDRAAAPVTAFGNEPGALRQPEALAVEPDGTVLVGDHLSGRIQLFPTGAPRARRSG